MELVFATNNVHKLAEVRNAVGSRFRLRSLDEIGCREEIPETGATLEENALQKADFIFRKYNQNCFADDSGLEIDALNGKPGVYSSRYAGPQCSFEDNMNKVLSEMSGITNRNARFRTVIALFLNGKEFYFDGIVEGYILDDKRGRHGFGYDPIFLPHGSSKTLAEMTLEEKNRISHRAKAIAKLIDFLQSASLK